MSKQRSAAWLEIEKRLVEVASWNQKYLYHQAVGRYRNRLHWLEGWFQSMPGQQAVKPKEMSSVLESWLKTYDHARWYKKLWLRLTQPISRLKKIDAHQRALLTLRSESEQPLEAVVMVLRRLEEETSFLWMKRRRSLRGLRKEVFAMLSNKEEIEMESGMGRRQKTWSYPVKGTTSLGHAVRDLLERVLESLKRYGNKVVRHRNESHDELVQKQGLTSEEDCQREGLKLAKKAVLDRGYKTFPGWLGRFNRKKEEDVQWRRLIYYQSLRLVLERLLEELRRGGSFDASGWEPLKHLLCEGLMLGMDRGGAQIEKAVWKAYRAGANQLIELAGCRVAQDDDSDLACWLKKTAKDLECLKDGMRIRHGRIMNPSMQMIYPLEAERRLEDLVILLKRYQGRSEAIAKRYGEKYGLFNVHQKEQLVEGYQRILKAIEGMERYVARVGVIGILGDDDLIEGDEHCLKEGIENCMSEYGAMENDYESLVKKEPLILNKAGKEACEILDLNSREPIYWSMVQDAFNYLALKYHPDKNPEVEAIEKFRAGRSAYELLKDLKEGTLVVVEASPVDKTEETYERIRRSQEILEENKRWYEEWKRREEEQDEEWKRGMEERRRGMEEQRRATEEQKRELQEEQRRAMEEQKRAMEEQKRELQEEQKRAMEEQKRESDRKIEKLEQMILKLMADKEQADKGQGRQQDPHYGQGFFSPSNNNIPAYEKEEKKSTL